MFSALSQYGGEIVMTFTVSDLCRVTGTAWCLWARLELESRLIHLCWAGERGCMYSAREAERKSAARPSMVSSSHGNLVAV